MNEGRDQVELVPVDDRLSCENLMSGGSFSHVDWATNCFPSLARTGVSLSFFVIPILPAKRFFSLCCRLTRWTRSLWAWSRVCLHRDCKTLP